MMMVEGRCWMVVEEAGKEGVGERERERERVVGRRKKGKRWCVKESAVVVRSSEAERKRATL